MSQRIVEFDVISRKGNEVLELNSIVAAAEVKVNKLSERWRNRHSTEALRLDSIIDLVPALAAGLERSIEIARASNPNRGGLLCLSEYVKYEHSSFIESYSTTSTIPYDDRVEDAIANGITVFLKSILGYFSRSNHNELNLNRLVASCLAHLTTYIDSKWRWGWGLLQSFQVKCLSNSQLAVNIVAASTPGSLTDQKLCYGMSTFVTKMLQQGVYLDKNTTVLMQFDNIQFGKVHTSLNSVKDKLVIPVVTSVAAYHMLQDGTPNLQKDIRYAPTNWRPLEECMDVSKDGDPLLFTVTDHLLRNDSKYPIESELKEEEVWGNVSQSCKYFRS